MSREKQVDALHYRFSDYMDQRRWASLWYQMNEILRAEPRSVLEVGKGAGLLGALLKQYDIEYRSVDIDPELEPDYAASLTVLPFENASFDVVVCFQVLEHLPFEEFPLSLKELARVARDRIVLSLPDARKAWPCSISIPKIGTIRAAITVPSFFRETHEFDGQHYWEINKRGFELGKIVSIILRNGLSLERQFRVPENLYHRFFVLNTTR